MNPARVAYCRTYQKAFRAVLPLLPYHEPEILNDMTEVADICEQRSFKSVLIMTRVSHHWV